LDFCAVARPGEREHQKDSSLYRREVFALYLEARRRVP
jgi:hypothetical protein